MFHPDTQPSEQLKTTLEQGTTTTQRINIHKNIANTQVSSQQHAMPIELSQESPIEELTSPLQQTKLQAIEDATEDALRHLEHLRSSRRHLHQENKELQTQLTALQSRNADLEDMLSQEHRLNCQLNDTVNQLQAQNAVIQEQLTKHLAESQALQGRNELLSAQNKMLLDQNEQLQQDNARLEQQQQEQEQQIDELASNVKSDSVLSVSDSVLPVSETIGSESQPNPNAPSAAVYGVSLEEQETICQQVMHLRGKLDSVSKTLANEVKAWRSILPQLNIPFDLQSSQIQPDDAPNKVLQYIQSLQARLASTETELTQAKQQAATAAALTSPAPNETVIKGIQDLHANLEYLKGLNRSFEEERGQLEQEISRLQSQLNLKQQELHALLDSLAKKEQQLQQAQAELSNDQSASATVQALQQELEATKDALMIAKHAAQAEREDATALRALYDSLQLAGMDRCIERVQELLKTHLSRSNNNNHPTPPSDAVKGNGNDNLQQQMLLMEDFLSNLTEICNSQSVPASKLSITFLQGSAVTGCAFTPRQLAVLRQVIDIIAAMQQAQSRLSELSLKFDALVSSSSSNNNSTNKQPLKASFGANDSAAVSSSKPSSDSTEEPSAIGAQSKRTSSNPRHHRNRTYEGFYAGSQENEVETLENIIFEQENYINQLEDKCELLSKRNVELANLNLR